MAFDNRHLIRRQVVQFLNEVVNLIISGPSFPSPNAFYLGVWLIG